MRQLECRVLVESRPSSPNQDRLLCANVGHPCKLLPRRQHPHWPHRSASRHHFRLQCCSEVGKFSDNVHVLSMTPRPRPSILDDFESLGFVHGAMRWRSWDRKLLYTWDSLHGKIEVFDARGRHVGVLHAITGSYIKDAVRGRTIDA